MFSLKDFSQFKVKNMNSLKGGISRPTTSTGLSSDAVVIFDDGSCVFDTDTTDVNSPVLNCDSDCNHCS